MLYINLAKVKNIMEYVFAIRLKKISECSFHSKANSPVYRVAAAETDAFGIENNVILKFN